MAYISIQTLSIVVFIKAVSWDPQYFLYILIILENCVPNIPIKITGYPNLFVCGKFSNNKTNNAKHHIANLWFSANKLSFSIEYICFNVFGMTNSKKQHKKLKVNNFELNQVESTNYLV